MTQIWLSAGKSRKAVISLHRKCTAIIILLGAVPTVIATITTTITTTIITGTAGADTEANINYL